jgi:hypothetical protein
VLTSAQGNPCLDQMPVDGKAEPLAASLACRAGKPAMPRESSFSAKTVTPSPTCARAGLPCLRFFWSAAGLGLGHFMDGFVFNEAAGARSTRAAR